MTMPTSQQQYFCWFACVRQIHRYIYVQYSCKLDNRPPNLTQNDFAICCQAKAGFPGKSLPKFHKNIERRDLRNLCPHNLKLSVVSTMKQKKCALHKKISYAKMNWLFCRNLGYLAMVSHFH